MKQFKSFCPTHECTTPWGEGLWQQQRQSVGVVGAAPPRTPPGPRDGKEGAPSGDIDDSRCQCDNVILVMRVTVLVWWWWWQQRNGQHQFNEVGLRMMMMTRHGTVASMPSQWTTSVQQEWLADYEDAGETRVMAPSRQGKDAGASWVVSCCHQQPHVHLSLIWEELMCLKSNIWYECSSQSHRVIW
jgi:hypothetical protein